MKNHLVVALAYDHLCTFEFGCTVELFALQRPELNVNWYRFAVCAIEKGKIRAAGGVTLKAPYSLSMLDQADTIIIPGWRNPDELPAPALLKKLREAHHRGARICSICSGVFVLAAAGILNGKAVTTHWRYAEKFLQKYPDIELKTNALYVDQENIMTSAGSAAGLDMLLHLIRKDHGPRVANLVAQRLVVAPHREGDQAQFTPRPLPKDEHARLTKLMAWIRLHPHLPHDLNSMAKRAAMSTRTLQRHFNETTGLAPGAWVIRERVAIAKELLVSPTIALSQVATMAGFGSEESMRRHFRRLVNTSPLHYRKQFADAAQHPVLKEGL